MEISIRTFKHTLRISELFEGSIYDNFDKLAAQRGAAHIKKRILKSVSPYLRCTTHKLRLPGKEMDLKIPLTKYSYNNLI